MQDVFLDINKSVYRKARQGRKENNKEINYLCVLCPLGEASLCLCGKIFCCYVLFFLLPHCRKDYSDEDEQGAEEAFFIDAFFQDEIGRGEYYQIVDTA